MTVNITYPHIKRKIERIRVLRNMARFGLVFAGVICVFLNLVIGGPAWSAIVVWAVWTGWILLTSPDFVSCNRLSLCSKLVFNAALLLALITLLFSRKAAFGVPLTWFIGECTSGVLFFTDIRRQKQNMAPMLMLLLVGLVGSAAGMIFISKSWVFIAVGAAAAAILIGCVAVLRGELTGAFKKAMHVK